ncbi:MULTISPECIES: ATP-dependent nuclease [Pseudomonas aeruginosa group]|uniref:ATP-dependent nuclease n=1 Tax=Pseudomonas aeruginosa group TaxID=136841 RepID=UPI00106BEFC5|nr:ATP-dependent endonuclease [Pseudomonas aeruginosa]MCT0389604.1 ATP-dependent endonuclease [Pseudomonas aeruginosa]MCY0316706.1 ATP-dependent endonuclease [Pseudomonas aeruginosa]MCY0322755.1 ATP-dependent endonuclease [Pseudomonas aeruginosa]MCY0390330.1 ATP-dependent endonuclease [Pseudomonas aeruginosa]MCY0432692.1 ATP-dependent endonuclease [Pseudomonas aeruginosa]
MHLKKLAVRNFRRLQNVVIDLASDISIFVGANNSGKTSVGHALQLFTGSGRFNIHDFSAELWADIVAFGEGDGEASLPTMEIDVWFEIGPDDVHRVIDLLPSLAWEGNLVGMRVAYAPTNPTATRARYVEVRQRVLDAVAKGEDGAPAFDPSPRNLREFLRDRLHDEYELRYFVLDPARFDAKMVAEAGYDPAPLTGRDRSGREILNGLLHIDFLNAQRHLSDGPGGSRAEDLSRVLSRFYGRNLEQKGEDIEALRALAASEVSLNEHLERVFEPTLKSLSKLGYPGLSNPRMMIRSALDPAQIMSGRDGAVVHYALGGADEGNPDPPTLPDRYNGLGFKNLIFMVVELLDLHAQWLAIEENRPPVHLIFIEEPEAHLHAQLQQAFIRKVMDILTLKGEDRTHYTSQVVVTTHSTHILYERGFRPVRYFRRSRARNGSTSDVLNLSVFYDNTDPDIRSFLERYLKLAHCDLFFADGAVLVEGNVERLLLPQMIANAAPRLQSTYLTVLEIGGAFGYRFKALIEFLGLTTLIITDLDSVFGPLGQDGEGGAPAGQPGAAEAVAENAQAAGADAEEIDDDEADLPVAAEKPGKACIAGHPGAVTSNQTLLQWLPKCDTVAALWEATAEQKIQARMDDNDALVRVAYQCRTDVTWGGETLALAGRTLEEAFALENLEWCQDKNRKPLQLRIAKAEEKNLTTLAERIHKRVQAKSFSKTDFALALLAEDPSSWLVPTYIAEGLSWLETEIAPPEPDEDQPHEDAPQGAPAAVGDEVAA